MIFWNFKTPLTLLACLVWNASELFHIPLGDAGPRLFGLAIGIRIRGRRIT
jgi:hypothetical protein